MTTNTGKEPPIMALLSTPTAQVTFAVCTVLIVGTVLFALVYSILTGTSLNPVASGILSFILGVASSLLGGQWGVSVYGSGSRSGAETVSTAATTLSGSAQPGAPGPD